MSAGAPAHAGAVVVTVADVPAGRYALMAFADANANGVLDKNMLGVPKEGFGFSNDATRRFPAAPLFRPQRSITVPSARN